MSNNKDHNQFYPFDDFSKDFIPWDDPFNSDIFSGYTWRDIAAEMRKGIGVIPTSLVLGCSMAVYNHNVRNYGLDEALKKFWEVTSCLSKEDNFPWLTDSRQREDMWEVLCKAKDGYVDAAQIMVRACPRVIELPFIRDILWDLLEAKTNQNNIPYDLDAQTIRKLWNGFLRSDRGGHVTYSPKPVAWLIDRCVRESKENISVMQARKMVAKEIGVSIDWINSNCSVQTKRGRPRK